MKIHFIQVLLVILTVLMVDRVLLIHVIALTIGMEATVKVCSQRLYESVMFINCMYMYEYYIIIMHSLLIQYS